VTALVACICGSALEGKITAPSACAPAIPSTSPSLLGFVPRGKPTIAPVTPCAGVPLATLSLARPSWRHSASKHSPVLLGNFEFSLHWGWESVEHYAHVGGRGGHAIPPQDQCALGLHTL
jgi:hypothetical protein